jgi:hypothetical protein
MLIASIATDRMIKNQIGQPACETIDCKANLDVLKWHLADRYRKGGSTNLASVVLDQRLSTEPVDNSVRIPRKRGSLWLLLRLIKKYAIDCYF